jgi:hypothetical protein
MRSFKKRALTVAASATVAIGASLFVAGPAAAVPAHCSGRYDNNAYSAYCYGGSGSFRAVVRCYNASGTRYVTRYGVWRATGSTSSVATCRSTEDPASGYAQLR